MTISKGIGREHTIKSLLAYAAPTIGVMIFVSVYTMIDGIFVARYVNATALSAVNIFMPIYALIFAIALMLGTGGSAIIAKKMGEKKFQEARSNFTLIVLFGTVIGLLIMSLGLLFIQPLLALIGATADEQLFNYTFTYAKILLMVSPLITIQMMFENFFVTAGKPNLSLVITLIGGSLNIALDYVFIVVMNMGIEGAALATAIGITIPAFIGIGYFLFARHNMLYFSKPKVDWKIILNSCINGSSEMITNLSLSFITFAFNLLMLDYIGVEGVAAVTIMLYLMMFLTPVFMGYSVGIAPIISYNYGSQNKTQLKRIFKISTLVIGISSIAVFALSLLFGPYLIQFMVEKGSDVYHIAIDGFRIFSIGFLFMGINIFTSMLFTALSNGKVSAFISLLRTFVFVLTGLWVLPLLLGVNGIWLAIPLAEFLSLIVCTIFLLKHRNVYNGSNNDSLLKGEMKVL
ncbi:MATE family efflux transporter [Salipaludibacillus agaradhaerens]|uniref:Multidrug export protein MepA n=1 Tax=Salipaludibacillus agaradhaerens TaxID=76935 RepID=A0A9Q4B479_SALAG|nr:MATE family efflux transporter [Salipaludibacillus agaradhaerens]MCR6098032.1 MATE family efflux transporter [Salipaludibacillus agaradhaerens]MCR6116339.1 MATE family efflux transporter [Salipaludibacillus agaradhaerens]